MCKTVASVAPAVSIGTSRSTGWHSEAPALSVVASTFRHLQRHVFGSRVAYPTGVA